MKYAHRNDKMLLKIERFLKEKDGNKIREIELLQRENKNNCITEIN